MSTVGLKKAKTKERRKREPTNTMWLGLNNGATVSPGSLPLTPKLLLSFCTYIKTTKYAQYSTLYQVLISIPYLLTVFSLGKNLIVCNGGIQSQSFLCRGGYVDGHIGRPKCGSCTCTRAESYLRCHRICTGYIGFSCCSSSWVSLLNCFLSLVFPFSFFVLVLVLVRRQLSWMGLHKGSCLSHISQHHKLVASWASTVWRMGGTKRNALTCEALLFSFLVSITIGQTLPRCIVYLVYRSDFVWAVMTNNSCSTSWKSDWNLSLCFNWLCIC